MEYTQIKNINKWKQSLKLMLELYANGALEILLGKVDTLQKNYLNLEEKQELFKYFIHILRPMYDENYKIIYNGTYVFLELFKDGFYLKRKSDLTPKECQELIFLLNNINKYKMIKQNYSTEDMQRFFNYKEQVQKSANLVGLYSKFNEHIYFPNEKRKHLILTNQL